MKVFAYCAASFERSVRKAAGVRPLLSPPHTYRSFRSEWLSGYDFLYFKLHGLPHQPYWYGDNWTTAITAAQIRQADLAGTVVFVANCHLFEITDIQVIPSPMMTALFDAGARYVVGGPGPNYARSQSVQGADSLGQHFRRLLCLGLPPEKAFNLAHNHLKRKRRKNLATKDTLQFRIFAHNEFRREDIL